MPVASVSSRRNGVEDGQAPVQMPHPAQSAGIDLRLARVRARVGARTITTASYGQSAKQRAQPLQLSRLTRAAGARGTRTAGGAASVSSGERATRAHSPPGEPGHQRVREQVEPVERDARGRSPGRPAA